MKSNTYPHLHYHTWRDIRGPIGLVLNAGLCLVIFVSAIFMIVIGTILVGLDYAGTKFWNLLGRDQR